MTDESFPSDRLSRILNAVETIEASLGILARTQSMSREAYHADSDTQDIVERRFVKMTEAAIDIGEELVKHELGAPPTSNPESMRALEELDILSVPTADAMAQGARSAMSSHTPTVTLSNTMWCTMHCRISSGTGSSSSKSATTSSPSEHLTNN